MGVIEPVVPVLSGAVPGALVPLHPLVAGQTVEGELEGQGEIEAAAGVVRIAVFSEKVGRVVVGGRKLRAERPRLEGVVRPQAPFQVILAGIGTPSRVAVIDQGGLKIEVGEDLEAVSAVDVELDVAPGDVVVDVRTPQAREEADRVLVIEAALQGRFVVRLGNASKT